MRVRANLTNRKRKKKKNYSCVHQLALSPVHRTGTCSRLFLPFLQEFSQRWCILLVLFLNGFSSNVQSIGTNNKGKR